MRVCVIGAGVIGVTSAYFLARQGIDVTLVDARSQPGEETSFANGGQLSYSYVAPLAGPGVLGNVPSWLLRKDSPLRFRPRLDPDQWRWCLQFALACRASVARASTAQMLTLSYLSRDVLHALLKQEPLSFGHKANGKLIVYRSTALMEKARALVEYQANHGAEQRVLSSAETAALEPALAGMRNRMAGAIYTPGEEVGDCLRFTQALFGKLAAMSNVQVRMSTPIAGLQRAGARVVAARSRGGDVEADAFVVACGMGARALLRPLGQNVSIYGLKGYSLSVAIQEGAATAPVMSVTDYERRIVYARIGALLRIAAMVDIGGEAGVGAPEPSSSRIALLKRQVREAFGDVDLDAALPWAGLRPATPGGKPLIGPSRAAGNVWLNVGHGALGFTLACGSAALLTSQLAGLPTPIDARPFLPS